MKKCTKCNIQKSLDCFNKKTSYKDGFDSICKKCTSEHRKKLRISNSQKANETEKLWKKNNPSKVKEKRRKQLLKQYGLTVADWDNILASQNGLCAICNKPETTIIRGKVNRLSIDHCHITGKNRGLLCDKCNRALGLFQDDAERLNRAADYLRNGSA
jgi:hypothetical protein